MMPAESTNSASTGSRRGDPVKKSVLMLTIGASAPLLALGVGAPTAAAAPTSTPSIGGASVSVNGHTVGFGNSSASTTAGSHSIAVAINGSTATAAGSHN